jgi:hypothetical protein
MIDRVARLLQEEWDPAGEFVAPDGSRSPVSHAQTILAMFAPGGDVVSVMGYLRRAEEASLGAARTGSPQRGDLARRIWRLLLDAATAQRGE